MNHVRVVAGMVMVVGLVLWAGRDVRRTAAQWQKNPDGLLTDVVWFEGRTAAIRDQLPARGVVGYRDEQRGRRSPPNDLDAHRRATLIQYAVVPLIVEWGTDREPAVVVRGVDVTVSGGVGP